MLLRAFNSWCWVVAFLSFAKRCLSFANRALKYASEGSLPFYMLHQTVIVVIGSLIAEWHMSIVPKYLMLAPTSFITIMTIYELPIGRIDAFRILFGMKAGR